MNQHKRFHGSAGNLSDCRRTICLSVLGESVVRLHLLTSQTRRMLKLRMFKQVFSCMNIANRMYESGNQPQKIAVEKIFIESLSTMETSCSKADWDLVRLLMPEPIYKAYRQLSIIDSAKGI